MADSGAIVVSGRPPTPLDAGSLGQLLFSRVLAELGGEVFVVCFPMNPQEFSSVSGV